MQGVQDPTTLEIQEPEAPHTESDHLPRSIRPGRKWPILIAINTASLIVFVVIGEIGCRWFWNARYWLRSETWIVGAGQTEAGRKWWPNTTYSMESAEFKVRFRTDEQGYRARPGPSPAGPAYRIAFVGDSLTEAVQVEYEQTFCALIERKLAGTIPNRAIICRNYGVAATSLFDYWHRITHDVLRPDPPDALVLCIYPGNDFSDHFPDEGFEPDGRPRREYYSRPHWTRHALTWAVTKSKLANFIILKTVIGLMGLTPPAPQGPWLWWADPEVAAEADDCSAVRRSRALLEAIAAECRAHQTRLIILVVGPVLYGPDLVYTAKQGESPLARMLANWRIDVPVIDLAIDAAARPDCRNLVFAHDGHLNEQGHAFVAHHAVPALVPALRTPAGGSSEKSRPSEHAALPD